MASIKPAAATNTIIYVSIEYLDDLQRKINDDIFSFCFGKILFYLFIQSNLALNKKAKLYFLLFKIIDTFLLSLQLVTGVAFIKNPTKHIWLIQKTKNSFTHDCRLMSV
jgi:hypothetical protein